MKLKNYIGLGVLLSPFIGLFGYAAYIQGLPFILPAVYAIVVAGYMLLGAWLFTSQ